MRQQIVILDGAMGTTLQKQGLQLGEISELLCLTDPQRITAIHKSYVDAGARLIYANTFGANRFKLEKTGHSVDEVIAVAVGCAKDACRGTDAKVAMSAGACGRLLRPAGNLSFDECYALYREMAVAGENAGADCLVFETMMDLAEARIALLAAKENTSLPVFVTMTYEKNGRTFLGCDVRAMGITLEGCGADAVGINCSLGPDEMYPVVQALSESTSLPLILKLNAGLPDPQTGEYTLSPQRYAQLIEPYLDLGVAYLGGCCGTTDAHIRELSKLYKNKTVKQRSFLKKSQVCSSRNVVDLDRMRIVGERINPTGKKRLQLALREQDDDYILGQAVSQSDLGADLLDINVGLPQLDEAAAMGRIVEGVQGVCDLPLMIDSGDPKALEAGLRGFCGKAIVNSVNGDPAVLETILPIAKKYGAAVVGLCTDGHGVPQDAFGREAIARRIVQAADAHGISREDVYIDCLTLTVSAQQDQAAETLNALARVKQTLGCRTVLGVSNISFGLPRREALNSAFLAMAAARGLDLAIVNPSSEEIMATARALSVLMNHDPGAERFISAYGGQEKTISAVQAGEREDLSLLVRKGLKREAREETRRLLSSEAPMDIVEKRLIPALDLVGKLFEEGTFFLPQLLRSAETAQAAFDLIREKLAQNGAPRQDRGRIVVATVQGDIHDIGKNITKCILENYGFQVLDLGKDVPIEAVAETVAREGIKLVGLSALMTTTLPNMEITVAAIRKAAPGCRVFCAGAVLTEEYAMEMGADFYAKDAMQSVTIAQRVLEEKA